MKVKQNFIISCVGAYADSGVGTGGLVCINNGCAKIIDKMDSTGLFVLDSMIFRFVRSMNSLFSYDHSGLRLILKLPDSFDTHDLLVSDGKIICVSTGSNEIHWYDFSGKQIKKWKADGERDAWHLNCLTEKNGELFISAFGEFEAHRGWLDKSKSSGFIMNIQTGEKVVDGLSGPHNPRCLEDGSWAVCDSHNKGLAIKHVDGTVSSVDLGGFTRGFALDDSYFYVGVSVDRNHSCQDEKSHIAIIDRSTLQVSETIPVPFPEIYDIVTIPDDFANSLVDNINSLMPYEESDRIRELEHQVERGIEEIARIKAGNAFVNKLRSLKKYIHG